MKILSAKQAINSMPQSQPVSRELWRKVMEFTFHMLTERSKVGYNYIELSLTKIPELEQRRIKVLKRLGYKVQELEFSLHVNW